jgi:hypothetical protein
MGSNVPPPSPVPPGNLEPGTVADLLRADFRAAWKGIAADERTTGVGGNFMFAGLAMTYLELSCRTASSDVSGRTLSDYGRALHEREPRYFAELPCKVSLPRDLSLPTYGTAPVDRQLLTLLFDLIRNGQAHQYQQIPLRLVDGRHLTIALSGATNDRPIDEAIPRGDRPEAHLMLDDSSEPLRWLICPDVLFLDFERASRAARVFSQGLRPVYLSRKLPLSTEQLRAALASPPPAP